MLNLNPLRERLHKGFSPLIITAADRWSFEPPHPHRFAVGRGVVVVLREGDASAEMDARHIVSVEDRLS